MPIPLGPKEYEDKIWNIENMLNFNVFLQTHVPSKQMQFASEKHLVYMSFPQI